MSDAAAILIGIVGYYPFVPGYPLGRKLMDALESTDWPEPVTIREMNWGPVAIVQDFQARDVRHERVVLIGLVNRGLPRGTVTCRRWRGGELPADALQQRMFEAVTGVVHLDNLLAIGEHFGIWPGETFTVELEMVDNVGDYVIELLERDAPGRETISGGAGSSGIPDRHSEAVANLARQLAVHGAAGTAAPAALRATELTPVAQVCQNRDVGGTAGRA